MERNKYKLVWTFWIQDFNPKYTMRGNFKQKQILVIGVNYKKKDSKGSSH